MKLPCMNDLVGRIQNEKQIAAIDENIIQISVCKMLHIKWIVLMLSKFGTSIQLALSLYIAGHMASRVLFM